ncbi:Zinc finger CCCH domain-containing protein 15 [Microtus ochrogaster]|uniref:Zinc finger CCCH domain-containing protein 15 n=1 Tax=Microtus ochrogaster TaxID=79684 RepID=A0A8J6KRI8_MICOH|nr:Zinc finger CCCH domain-containing protein 15 [Microtus ochrogaster]
MGLYHSMYVRNKGETTGIHSFLLPFQNGCSRFLSYVGLAGVHRRTATPAPTDPGDSSPTDRAVTPARSHEPSTPPSDPERPERTRSRTSGKGGAPLLPPHNAARRRPVAKAASGRRMSASLSVRCGGGRVFLLPPCCRTPRRSPSAPHSSRRPRLLRDAPQETGSGRGQQEGGAEEEGEDHRGAYPSPLSPRGAGASPAAEHRSRGHVSASSPDKTFGLKNKKGAKQQKFIKAVTHQVKFGQQNPRQVAQSEAEKKLKKDDRKKELQELNELFKPVVAAQKISKGADPKSVVCAFFKQGQCTKGDKCKFSHDLTLERKCEKRSVYIDARDEELEKDTMDNWDEKKLEEVVNKKHGEAEKKKPKTQIVCRHFLEAIENNKYGWFWVCPGGGDNCMYRHALPPGFVLKKDKKKEEKEDEISLEDLIERERSALGPNVTKITLESFLAWKKRKRQEKIDKLEQDMERRKADFKAGKALVISGREVFEFRPELVNDDDEEADDTRYIQGAGGDEVDDSVGVNDIDVSLYIPRDVEETGITVASLERFSTYASDRDENKLSEASGGRAENGERSDLDEDSGVGGQENGSIDAVPVDENLFTGEDLDELEEELNTLDLEE